MFYVHASGCGGYEHGAWTAPTPCGRPVVAAGPVFYRYPHPQVWLGFACAAHVDLLEVARPVTVRDQAVLAHRRARQDGRRDPDPAAAAQRELERDGPGHTDPGRPGRPGRDEVPLATGRAAYEFVERAHRWAAAHPEQTFPVAAVDAAHPTSNGPPPPGPSPTGPASAAPGGAPVDADASTPSAGGRDGGGR